MGKHPNEQENETSHGIGATNVSSVNSAIHEGIKSFTIPKSVLKVLAVNIGGIQCFGFDLVLIKSNYFYLNTQSQWQ